MRILHGADGGWSVPASGVESLKVDCQSLLLDDGRFLILVGVESLKVDGWFQLLVTKAMWSELFLSVYYNKKYQEYL